MRTTECLSELIDYWYRCDTERVKQYVQEERDWPAEMVDEFQLGWASPDSQPYVHLRDAGYSHEEVISTGAFSESGSTLWKGRYVFPYFNADGDVVYAIARATGIGGGAAGYDGHEDDFLAGKYAKLAHTKDFADVDEPIWGTHTIDRDGKVIVTEGIADAMILDYYGYPVISPVTTSFKDKHYEPLLDVLSEHNKDEVVIIPDSEEIQETAKYGVSVGVQGALTSASKIYEQTDDIEVYVAELPRLDEVEKVDVDSFLSKHSAEDLQQILRGAVEAAEYDVYEDIASDKIKQEYEYDYEPTESDSNSALYDLTIDDVLPTNRSGRSDNPVKHRGKSKNYFVRMSSETAYDHKADVTYNALTYLLCEVGHRDVEAPEGPLSDEEIYGVWYHAKDKGIIDEDDAIPTRAMKHVARELGLEPPEDDILPMPMYNQVVEEVDERIGSGRSKLTNTSKEFYADKSAYYQMDADIVTAFCDSTQEFENLIVDDYMWTADGIDGWIPSLALVAVEEGYISKDNLTPKWAGWLRDTDFADLCLDAQEKYMFGGKPPYRALLGVAKKNGYELNDEGLLTSESRKKAKSVFYSN